VFYGVDVFKLTGKEPMGIERLKEALETNDWEGADGLESALKLDDIDEVDGDEDDGSIGFGIDPTEMADEMAGMKRAIYGGVLGEETGEGEDEAEDDDEVDKLQAMMLKMQAVRGEHFPVFPGLANISRYGCGLTRSGEEKACGENR
jgi:hypothetical protein